MFPDVDRRGSIKQKDGVKEGANAARGRLKLMWTVAEKVMCNSIERFGGGHW